MLDLAKAVADDFAPSVNEEFTLLAGEVTVVLRLKTIEKLRHGHAQRREPFTLRFMGEPALRLPQAIYALQSATLGTVEMFLVQTGADADGSYVEAVFN